MAEPVIYRSIEFKSISSDQFGFIPFILMNFLGRFVCDDLCVHRNSVTAWQVNKRLGIQNPLITFLDCLRQSASA